MQICIANLTSDLDGVKNIFNDFDRSPDFPARYQFLGEENDVLPKIYSLPKGAILLAKDQHTIAGFAALKSLGVKICELSRLYIKPEYRGKKLGRLLLVELLSFARLAGYKIVKTQAQPSMKAALNLYKSIGFEIISPKVVNSFRELVYLEKKL